LASGEFPGKNPDANAQERIPGVHPGSGGAIMRRLLVAVGFVAILLMPRGAWAEPQYPFLHSAVYEMMEAVRELRDAPRDFAGHKVKAIHALNQAIHQVEKMLDAVGEPFKGHLPPKGAYDKYANHPHLRQAVVEMRDALALLKETTRDFGGHRDKAIRDIGVAIAEVDWCIERIK
jgi:hypothetical protein